MEKKASPKSNMPIFIGDLSRRVFVSFFSPLTICLWHIPQSEKEPMLWSVILDGFYVDLFHAFSSKNSWLLPRVQNDHMRFKGTKIFCLSIVMSCSHDDSILVSFSVYRVTVNSSFDFSQKREAMTWFKINDKATCYWISSFLCKEKAVIVLTWCVRADSVKLCAMRMRTANTSENHLKTSRRLKTKSIFF